MKFRKDFVTNSSSSSFIAVFGTSNNNEIALQSAKENGLDFCVFTGKELLNQWNAIYRENTCNDWCWVDPFPNKKDIDDNILYFIYSDCEDVNADEDGYICKDEVDDHYEEVSSKLDKLEGFTLNYSCGSGRNG